MAVTTTTATTATVTTDEDTATTSYQITSYQIASITIRETIRCKVTQVIRAFTKVPTKL